MPGLSTLSDVSERLADRFESVWHMKRGAESHPGSCSKRIIRQPCGLLQRIASCLTCAILVRRSADLFRSIWNVVQNIIQRMPV